MFPGVIKALAGVSAIELSVAEVTFISPWVCPWTEPSDARLVAVIVEEPLARPVTVPVSSTDVLEKLFVLHVTRPVRFCVLESLNIPIGVIAIFAPMPMDALAGNRAIEVSVAPLTLKLVVPVIDPFGTWTVAVIVVVPTAVQVIRLFTTNESKLATPVFDDDHVTRLVTSRVLPSTKVPIAAN